MRARIVAILTAALGFGLVSGALAQVAALDGDLERAALKRPVPVQDRHECPPEERRVRWRAS